MKRNVLDIFLILFSVVLYFVVAQNMNLQAESPSLSEKFNELSEKHKAASVFQQETLSIPLLSSQPSAAAGLSEGISFMNEPYTVGHEGNLTYLERDNGGFHLQANDLKKEAAFSFTFENPLDLRNRWLRLRYGGMGIPTALTLKFDSVKAKKDFIYPLPLENTYSGDYVLFKLPDGNSFGQIHSLRLVFDPDHLDEQNVDFLIENFEVLPAGENPLQELPESDLSRFDWYQKS